MSICPIVSNPDFYLTGTGIVQIPRSIRDGLAGGAAGFECDLALSAVSPRLAQLFDKSAIANFRPLDPSAEHHRTIIVLFVPLVKGDKVYLEAPNFTGLPSGVTAPAANAVATIKNLQRAGVRFVVVKVKPNTDILDNYASVAGLVTLDSAVRNDDGKLWKELILDCGDSESPRKVAEAVLQQIKDWSEPRRMVLSKNLGRVVDDRTINNAHAPWKRFAVPESVSPSHLFAFVEDGSKKIPLIESRMIGEGRVTVLHYSPVSFDTWRQDATFPSPLVRTTSGDFLAKVALQPANPHGFGVQRFLDLAELNHAGEIRKDEPVLNNVRQTPAGDALLLDCWMVLASNSSDFKSPRVVALSGDAEFDCDLFFVDALSRNITFSLRAKTGPIDIGKSQLVFPTEIIPIHCPLKIEPTAFGSSLTEYLRSVATFSGGGEIRNATEIQKHLPRRLSQSWLLSAVILPLLSLLLLSPLCRSWSGFNTFLARFWARSSDEIKLPDPKAIETKVEGVMAKWGRHAGMPDAKRHSGEQAGRRAFQTGDSLSVCFSEGFVPFTSINDDLDLPQKKPVARLKKASRSMHAWILADVGTNLILPRTADWHRRAELLIRLCSVIGRTTWLQTGGVSIATLQNPEKVLGALYSVDSSIQLTEFVSQSLSVNPTAKRLALPTDCESGQVIYLISGLVGFTDAEVHQFLLKCVVGGIRLRVIQITDSALFSLSGLCLDDSTGAFSDRSNWSESVLRRLYLAMARDLSNKTARMNCRYYEAVTSRPFDEIVAELFESDFFR